MLKTPSGRPRFVETFSKQLGLCRTHFAGFDHSGTSGSNGSSKFITDKAVAGIPWVMIPTTPKDSKRTLECPTVLFEIIRFQGIDGGCKG